MRAGVTALVQVRMSAEGDWGSPGGETRMEEDAGAMPAFSDPGRDPKNSPTQSNFSAPDNLQGQPTHPLAIHHPIYDLPHPDSRYATLSEISVAAERSCKKKDFSPSGAGIGRVHIALLQPAV